MKLYLNITMYECFGNDYMSAETFDKLNEEFKKLTTLIEQKDVERREVFKKMIESSVKLNEQLFTTYNKNYLKISEERTKLDLQRQNIVKQLQHQVNEYKETEQGKIEDDKCLLFSEEVQDDQNEKQGCKMLSFDELKNLADLEKLKVVI